MNPIEFTTAPRASGAFGTAEESALPVRSGRSALAEQGMQSATSWLRVAVRVVRNAAIAVAIMAAVPVALVGIRGDRLWRVAQFGENTRTKSIIAERARSLVLPRDASITPTQ